MLESLIDENGNEISLIPPSRKYTCTKSESWTREYMYKSSSLGDYREKKKEIRKKERLEISR
jgi:hypothetical protein